MTKRVKSSRERGEHYIAAWREYRHLTQAQLAEMLNTTNATISRIEARKNGYTQAFLEACALALDCAPADLLRGPPDESNEILMAVNKLGKLQRLQAIKMLEILAGGNLDPAAISVESIPNPKTTRAGRSISSIERE